MKAHTPAWWLFWSSLGLILYTYLGFPLLTVLRARLRPKPVRGGPELPALSIIITAHNEASVIEKKLQNTLAQDYPPEKLEVIVASDGSDDGTNELVARFPSPQVCLLALPRQGKNRALNQAAAAAGGEVLVFTDADSMLQPGALRHLAAPFNDPEVGGVGGSYHYQKNGSGSAGERRYWNFDLRLRQLQSLSGSITGTTGHIYAVRRQLFTPAPPGVTDDAFISRQVVARHRRLVFAPEARASGPIADLQGEFRRKVRISTRGLNCILQQLYLLNPFEYGFFSLQLFSHKVLRRLMAFPLLVLFFSSLRLWNEGALFRLAGLGQIGLHGAAALGLLLRGTRLARLRFISLPFYLDLVNLATVIAVVNLLRGVHYDQWIAEREAGPGESAPGAEAPPQPPESRPYAQRKVQ